jgi:hypothetical protein
VRNPCRLALLPAVPAYPQCAGEAADRRPRVLATVRLHAPGLPSRERATVFQWWVIHQVTRPTRPLPMLDAAPRTKARSAICARGRMVGVIVSPKAGALRNAEPLTPIAPIRLISGELRVACWPRWAGWDLQVGETPCAFPEGFGSDPGR